MVSWIINGLWVSWDHDFWSIVVSSIVEDVFHVIVLVLIVWTLCHCN